MFVVAINIVNISHKKNSPSSREYNAINVGKSCKIIFDFVIDVVNLILIKTKRQTKVGFRNCAAVKM